MSYRKGRTTRSHTESRTKARYTAPPSVDVLYGPPRVKVSEERYTDELYTPSLPSPVGSSKSVGAPFSPKTARQRMVLASARHPLTMPKSSPSERQKWDDEGVTLYDMGLDTLKAKTRARSRTTGRTAAITRPGRHRGLYGASHLAATRSSPSGSSTKKRFEYSSKPDYHITLDEVRRERHRPLRRSDEFDARERSAGAWRRGAEAGGGAVMGGSSRRRHVADSRPFQSRSRTTPITTRRKSSSFDEATAHKLFGGKSPADVDFMDPDLGASSDEDKVVAPAGYRAMVDKKYSIPSERGSAGDSLRTDMQPRLYGKGKGKHLTRISGGSASMARSSEIGIGAGLMKTRFKRKRRSEKRRSQWLPEDMIEGMTSSLRGPIAGADGGSRLPNSVIFDLLDQTRWQLDTLIEIASPEDFSMYVGDQSTTSRQTLVTLAWDLLRTNDKCGELLHMVTSMNQHLEHEHLAFQHMMDSTVQALECQFAALWVFDEETCAMSCVCTVDGMLPDGELSFLLDTGTRRASRSRVFAEAVFKRGYHLSADMSATEVAERCPETGTAHLVGGAISVLGVPVKDIERHQTIAVLVAFRDISSFTDSDVKTGTILTGIAANTLKNLRTFSLARQQKKESEEIVNIIDEMSADIHQASYHSTIKKLLRKIRALVFCQKLDFWTVSGSSGSKKLTCEIAASGKFERRTIDVNRSHVLGQVAIAGLPKKIDSARGSDYTAEQLRYSRGESILIIPVVLSEDSAPIAVIQALNKIPELHAGLRRAKSMDRIVPFSKKDQRLLETLSKSASVIIRNSEMFTRIHGQKRKNAALVQILKVLQNKHDFKSMANEALSCVLVALDCELVSLWFDSGQGTLHLAHTVTNSTEAKSDLDISDVFTSMATFCAQVNDFINTMSLLEDRKLLDRIRQEFAASDSSSTSDGDSTGDTLRHFDMENAGSIADILSRLERRSALDVYRNDSTSVLCFPICPPGSDAVAGVILAAYQKQYCPFNQGDVDILSAIASEVAHTIERNITDFLMQMYLENDESDEMPLAQLDYFLMGSHEQQVSDIVVGRDDGSGSMDDETHSHVRRSVDLSIPTHLEKHFAELGTCDWNTVAHRPEDLEHFALYVYKDLGLIDDFKLDVMKLKLFVHTVRESYYDNPFHNWQHGFCVMQWVYTVLKQQCELRTLLKRLDVLALITGALGHDIEHPGTDNYFEAESDSPLAQIYNGVSVLENHHAHVTMRLLRNPKTNFMEGTDLKKSQVKEVKKTIVKSILTTDMSHHTETIEWLHSLGKEKVLEMAKNKDMKESDKNAAILKLCQCIIHLGDLAPQTYPWEVAVIWEERVSTEFFNQTKAETARGIPVRPWMTKMDVASRYKSQHFFIEHVLKPLWQPARMVLPTTEPRLAQLSANSKKYLELGKAQEAATKAPTDTSSS